MANSQKQISTAYMVVMIVLFLMLLGALGFIFWQNVIASKDTPVAERKVETGSDVTDDANGVQIVYTNDDLSFRYPASGWTVEAIQYGENAPPTLELKSPDYKQTGMGVDKGAIISVVVNEKATTLDKEYAALRDSSSNFGFEELMETTIGGQAAITYHSAYEGPRYHTVFVHEGKAYDVIYIYEANGDASTYMDAYTLITSSLKFKE